MAPAEGAMVSLAGEGAADWCLGTVEFLDFPTLGAYLAACRCCFRRADAPSAWEGWRCRHLDALVPRHVRWSTLADPRFAALESGLLRARCTYGLARGVRLYEEQLFAPAEAALRAALADIPRHEQLCCRLADVLYGRAVELRTEEPARPRAAAVPQPGGPREAPSSVPAAAAGDASGDDAGEEDSVAEEDEGRAETSAEALSRRHDAMLAEARGLYEEVLAVNPNNSYAINGSSLFTEDESERRRLLERAVELDGDNPYALANLASYLAGSDDKRAMWCLDHALAINPRLFYARLFKSKVLLRMGNLDGALEAAREHVQWRPGDTLARRVLAEMERQRALMRRQMLLA